METLWRGSTMSKETQAKPKITKEVSKAVRLYRKLERIREELHRQIWLLTPEQRKEYWRRTNE